MMDDLPQLLREHDLHVTAQRVAVLRAVTDNPHATADRLTRLVQRDIGAISRQAVYDALGVMIDRGLVRRIQYGGASARYETRVGDNHHHLICRSCDRVVDVECAVGAPPCLRVSDEHGFIIDEADVVFRGTCPQCVSASA